MRQPEPKELLSEPNGSPKPDVSGKPEDASRTARISKPRKRRKRGPCLPTPLYDKLREHVARSADTLRQDPEIGPAIDKNLKGFRADLERLIRLRYPLKCGRPRNPWLDALCKEMSQGKTPTEVLRAKIPGFDDLDLDTRIALTKCLHQACKRRKRRSARQ